VQHGGGIRWAEREEELIAAHLVQEWRGEKEATKSKYLVRVETLSLTTPTTPHHRPEQALKTIT